MKQQRRILRAVALLFTIVSALTGQARPSSELNFVYLTFRNNTLIGVAIYNPSDQDAELTFTAYDDDGNVVQAQGLQNPVQFMVKAREQFAAVTSAIFGQGGDPDTIAWFQVTSPVDGLTGFFIFLTGDFRELDGADLPLPSRELALTEVNLNPGFSTELTIVNPNDSEVTGTAALLGGPEPLSDRVTLPARSVLRFDVAERFGIENPIESNFLTLKADAELVAFAFVKSGDLLGLNARPLQGLLDTLYFPQMAVLGPFKTELVVIDNSDRSVIVTMTVFGEDGQPFGPQDLQQNPVALALEPGEVRRFDLAERFGFKGNELKQGWLKVESTEPSLSGSLSYSLTETGARAAVGTAARGTRRAIFSHLATTVDFFTGLAGLNPGSVAANVRVIAIRADGTVLGSFSTTLAPGIRFADLIGTDIIQEAAGQAGGAVIVESDVVIFLTAIFGSLQTGALANIPPQELPADFEVLGPALRVIPPLAVLSPSSTQQFQVVGGGQVQAWQVNGVSGGSAALGTLDGSGLFRAPAVLPDELPLTITARVGPSTVGASVDVITTSNLVADRGIVQSVAYLSGLNRLYTSELSASGSPLLSGAVPAGSEDSTIFDVTGMPVSQVRAFPTENIPKIIEYRAGDDQDYLLMAARSSGAILRLEPLTSSVREVASGFDSPNAIVLDPVTGALLVAEANQVSAVSALQLNQGLMATALSTDDPGAARARALVAGVTPAGVAVDACSGDIYISDAAQGAIIRIDRQTLSQSVVVDGLLNPGQLLAIYRKGVTCPDGFQLLVVEQGRNQITLVIPSQGTAQKWADAPGALDLASLPPDSGLADQGILIAGNPPRQNGVVSVVENDVNNAQTINPPTPPDSVVSGLVGFTSPDYA